MAVATGQTATTNNHARSLARREALTGYLFIAPYLIVGGIFIVVPFVKTKNRQK